MAACFVNARDLLNRTVWRVQSLDRFIARCRDRFSYPLIDFVLGIERYYFFARNIDNHFTEWNPPKLRAFIQQPRDQLIDRRFRGGLRVLLRKRFPNKQNCGGKNADESEHGGG